METCGVCTGLTAFSGATEGANFRYGLSEVGDGAPETPCQDRVPPFDRCPPATPQRHQWPTVAVAERRGQHGHDPRGHRHNGGHDGLAKGPDIVSATRGHRLTGHGDDRRGDHAGGRPGEYRQG
jgi:hypothetical protein